MDQEPKEESHEGSWKEKVTGAVDVVVEKVNEGAPKAKGWLGNVAEKFEAWTRKTAPKLREATKDLEPGFKDVVDKGKELFHKDK